MTEVCIRLSLNKFKLILMEFSFKKLLSIYQIFPLKSTFRALRQSTLKSSHVCTQNLWNLTKLKINKINRIEMPLRYYLKSFEIFLTYVILKGHLISMQSKVNLPPFSVTIRIKIGLSSIFLINYLLMHFCYYIIHDSPYSNF